MEHDYKNCRLLESGKLVAHRVRRNLGRAFGDTKDRVRHVSLGGF